MEDLKFVTLEDCEVERKLDGVLIGANDMRVLQIDFHFELTNLNCIIEPVFPTTYKGFDFGVGACKSFKVTLGKFNYMTLGMVFCVNASTFLNLVPLGAALRQLQLQLVDNMPNTSTWADWRAKTTDSDKKTLWMEDFYEFGNAFLEQSRDVIISECGHVLDSRLIIAGFGQDCKYSTIAQILSRMNFTYITQLVIHHALDFKIQNVVLMWDRNDLLHLFGRKQLLKEYNVCLLKGVGNYYYKMEESVFDDPFKVIETKCYSSAFKLVHRNKILPFGTPQIARDLFSPHEFALGFCRRYARNWKKTKAQCSAIHRIVNDISSTVSHLPARCEVIIQLDGDDFDAEDVQSIPQMLDQHPELAQRQLANCLRRIAIDKFRGHLNTNLMPFVTFLENQVNQRIEMARHKKLSVLTPGAMFTAMACEAVICFALYGNATFRQGKQMFPKWLVSSLGIGRYDYNKGEDFKLGEWMFPTIDHNSLEFRPINKSVSEMVNEISSSVGMDESLYRPLCELDELLEAANNVEIPNERINRVVRNVAGVIISSAFMSALYFGRKRLYREKVQPLQQLIKNYIRQSGTFEFITTLEFTDELFNNSPNLGGHGFLRWYVAIVKYICEGREILLQIKSMVRDRLENNLFRQCKLFILPIDVGRFQMVVPFAGTNKSSFSTLSDGKKEELLYLFEIFLPNTITRRSILKCFEFNWHKDTPFVEIHNMMNQ